MEKNKLNIASTYELIIKLRRKYKTLHKEVLQTKVVFNVLHIRKWKFVDGCARVYLSRLPFLCVVTSAPDSTSAPVAAVCCST